jgi:hypothetical protein
VHFIISQDIVATCSEFVVKYNNCFVVYLIHNAMLKKFGKSVNIWLIYGQKYRGPSFDSQCTYTTSVPPVFRTKRHWNENEASRLSPAVVYAYESRFTHRPLWAANNWHVPIIEMYFIAMATSTGSPHVRPYVRPCLGLPTKVIGCFRSNNA